MSGKFQLSRLSIIALRACVYYIRQLSSFRAPTLESDRRYLPYSIHFSELMPILFTRKRTKD